MWCYILYEVSKYDSGEVSHVRHVQRCILQSYPHRVDEWDGGWVLVGWWVGFCMVGWFFRSFVGCFTPYFNTDHVIPWRLVKLISASNFPSFYILTRQWTDWFISCVSFEERSSSKNVVLMHVYSFGNNLCYMILSITTFTM